MAISAPDLTQRAPRSPRVRLGGFVILPRMLDKGRATIIGKAGEYHYACHLDHRFLDYVGIDPEKLKEQLAQDKSDAEIIAWINTNSKVKLTPPEIVAWSSYAEGQVPTSVETRTFFSDIQKQAAPKREDIATWFDLLDVDDFVTFGGKA